MLSIALPELNALAAIAQAAGREIMELYRDGDAPFSTKADDSPLTIALNDTRLRAEGLAGDTVGDAVAFFGVREMELHNILCFCHHGATMSADAAAVRVRASHAEFRPLSAALRETCGVPGWTLEQDSWPDGWCRPGAAAAQ